MEWIGGVDGKDGDGTGVRQGSGARCVKGGMDEWMDGWERSGKGMCENGEDEKTRKMDERWGRIWV